MGASELVLLTQIKNKSVETVEINSLVDATAEELALNVFTRGTKEFLKAGTMVQATVEDYPDIEYKYRKIEAGIAESFVNILNIEQMVIDGSKIYAPDSEKVRVFDTDVGTYVNKNVFGASQPHLTYKTKSVKNGNKILLCCGSTSASQAKIVSSTDNGVTFTAQTTGAHTIAKAFSLAVNDAGTSWIAHSVQLSTPTAGDVWTSTDGLEWTSRTPSAAVGGSAAVTCNWIPFLNKWLYLTSSSGTQYWALSSNGYTIYSQGNLGGYAALPETWSIEADKVVILNKDTSSTYKKHTLDATGTWTSVGIEASDVVLASTTLGVYSSTTTADAPFINKVSFDGGVTTRRISDSRLSSTLDGKYAISKFMSNNFMITQGVNGASYAYIVKHNTDFSNVRWYLPSSTYGKALRTK